MVNQLLKILTICILTLSFSAFSQERIDFEEAIKNLNDGQDLALPLFSARSSYQARIDLALNPENDRLDVMTFTLAEDAVGFSLLAAALDIVETGRKVTLGPYAFSSKVSPELMAYMREKGVDIRSYRPLNFSFKNVFKLLKLVGIDGIFNFLNMRTHDKVFMTKHGTILGSSNYSKYYFLLAKKLMPNKKERWDAWTFLDREILVQGPAEEQARAEFDKKWEKKNFWSHGEEGVLTDEIRAKYDGEIAKQREFINNVKNTKKQNDFISVKDMEYVTDTFTMVSKNKKVHRRILEMITNAKSEIVIENPYVLLPTDVYKALLKARDRGVVVKIYTNKAGGSDEGDVSKQFKLDLKRLENSGFDVHLNESFYVFHGKVVVVDREQVYWGSYNFDNRSKMFNSENGVFFKSPDIAKMIYDRTVKNGIFRAVSLISEGKKSYKIMYHAKSCREFYIKNKVEKISLPQGFFEKLMMRVKEPLL